MLTWAVDQWTFWWDQLLNHYRVNPFIFVSMYSVKSVIYWYTVFLIVQRARKRDWDALPGLILLNVTTNVSPWVYVWLFGENLPGWYPYMVYWMAGWGIVYLVMQVRKKLRQYAGVDPTRTREGPPP